MLEMEINNNNDELHYSQSRHVTFLSTTNNNPDNDITIMKIEAIRNDTLLKQDKLIICAIKISSNISSSVSSGTILECNSFKL